MYSRILMIYFRVSFSIDDNYRQFNLLSILLHRHIGYYDASIVRCTASKRAAFVYFSTRLAWGRLAWGRLAWGRARRLLQVFRGIFSLTRPAALPPTHSGRQDDLPWGGGADGEPACGWRVRPGHVWRTAGFGRSRNWHVSSPRCCSQRPVSTWTTRTIGP